MPITRLAFAENVSHITSMSRHRKEDRHAAEEATQNRFAIYFGIAVVAVMALVVILAGIMN